ncbi:efflux RND transporter periplasmic adaptor subunit [Desulfatiferula olefinivorans]
MIRVRPMMLVGVLVLCLAWAGCGKTEQNAEPQPVRMVKMVDVSRDAAREILAFSGAVSPMQEVAMAFEVPGKLVELTVTEGQQVAAGQVLARLDDRDYRLAFDSKKAVYDTAAKDYDRAGALLKNQVISRKQYDDIRRNADVAEADMKSARKKLEDTVMTAPFNGRVARRLMDNFQNVQAKQTVMIFQDDKRLKLRVDVPEKDLTLAEETRTVEEANRLFSPMISLSAYPNRSFPAAFYEVSTSADPATRTFALTLSFSPPGDIVILPGMTARVTIRKQVPADTAKKDLFLPAQAVFSDEKGRPCVWVVHPEAMTVSRRSVQVANMIGSDIMILDGLSDGEIVAVSGVHQLREGMAVSRFRL